MGYLYTVGQRVRIVCEGRCNGMQATIWKIMPFADWTDYALACGADPNGTAYCLDVDGIGRTYFGGGVLFEIAYEAHELRPLADPAADQFIARLKKLGAEPMVAPPAKAPAKVPQ